MNPNLNDVLKTNHELFKHAWLQTDALSEHSITIALECYDRTVSKKEVTKLYDLIQNTYKSKLLNMFNVDYIEIDDYI